VALDGILLVDKDEGSTSFEVVRKIKRRLQVNKAGHTGTLDKSASGLLIICINRATSIQNLLMNNYKRYRAKILFGVETDTLDRYGQIVKTDEVNGFIDEEIEKTLKGFIGKINQIPPSFSAIHQNGVRLYKRAIKGEKFYIKPRVIEIKEISLLQNNGKLITIDVLASKGTYIRSLARDIANQLNTCGHLVELRRLSIGPFSVDKALKLEEIDADTNLIPISKALDYFPRLDVDNNKANMIFNGIALERVFNQAMIGENNNKYFNIMFNDKLIAIIEKGERIRYFKVFKDL